MPAARIFTNTLFFIQEPVFFHIIDLQIIWFYNLYCFHLFYLINFTLHIIFRIVSGSSVLQNGQ